MRNAVIDECLEVIRPFCIMGDAHTSKEMVETERVAVCAGVIYRAVEALKAKEVLQGEQTPWTGHHAVYPVVGCPCGHCSASKQSIDSQTALQSNT